MTLGLRMVPRGGQIRLERIWSNEVRPQGRAQDVHEQSNHRHEDFQSGIMIDMFLIYIVYSVRLIG